MVYVELTVLILFPSKDIEPRGAENVVTLGVKSLCGFPVPRMAAWKTMNLLPEDSHNNPSTNVVQSRGMIVLPVLCSW